MWYNDVKNCYEPLPNVYSAACYRKSSQMIDFQREQVFGRTSETDNGWQRGEGDRVVSGTAWGSAAYVARSSPRSVSFAVNAELHSTVDDNRNAIDWAATSPQGYNIWEIIAVNGGTTSKTQWYSPYNTKRDNSVLRFVTVLAPCINYLKLSYLLTYVSFNVGGDSERSNILIKNNTKIASHQAPQLGKSLFTILIIRQFKKYM